jgi:hypothetical protein
MPVRIDENSIIVFELIPIDVIAGPHTVHLIPPETVLIVLGTAFDRDKDHPFRRPNHLIGDGPLIACNLPYQHLSIGEGSTLHGEILGIISIDLASCFR